MIAYLLAHLDTEYIIGIRRVDKLELPVVALREAVVNAIAHRNYSSAANIQIYIFKNRVEIVNPGGLVAGMRKEDLGTKSLPRNPLLFNLMHRMRIVENIGSGFKRIHEAVTEYGMSDPIIEADENWFSLTFPRPEKIDSQKSSRENARNAVEKSREKSREKILSIIRADTRITISELAEKTGLSIKGIEKNIRLLKQENKLKRVGPDKGGHWEVV